MTFLYIAIILEILIIILLFYTFFGEDDSTDSDNFIKLAILRLFIIILSIIVMVCVSIYTNKPTAIDVYQGKTTLEITYKDGVPVDSVVVWKVDKN